MIKRLSVLLLLTSLGVIFAALLLGYTPDSELNLTGRYYADHTAQDIGAANIVTAIIVTYRGLDTLGEVTVLFLTAAIVGLVLARGRRPGKVPQRKQLALGELLVTGGHLLVPLILLLGAYVFINALLGNFAVPGFATLVVLISFFSGLILLMLGIIGEYLWRIFSALEDRPESVIEETHL